MFLCGVQARTYELCGVVAMGWAVLREIFPEVVGQSPRVFKAMKRLNIVASRPDNALVPASTAELVI